ncbi:MAG: sigma-70 family RNA polymerase sigma factor [Anaerolineae bacterium]|uniref:RNA polymerase sigma factor n=1 Tax=Thermoflexus sp. TaxID=1969742 RepID=UPI0025D9E722|nr:sigma-70 family RNA polymerase sigma factor [Thermoflexus sp.]MCS7351862.1 sigma-70 family RNA polymerase sigma factor [Thermoflexus sp.]MDW8181321.1 sigma-70 family RNA polymerase sigma factor [Anaerolineae bacterium]
MEEQEAIARWRRGDPEGMAVLVRQYQQRALRVAALILPDPMQAEDAVQAAFIRAWTYRKTFRPDSAFWPWFRQLVVHEALRLARREGREIPAESGPVEEAGGDPDSDPSHHLDSQETIQRLAQALERLSPTQRTIVVLRYYEGLSEEEIARALGCAVGTLKRHLHEARQRLRRWLSDRA